MAQKISDVNPSPFIAARKEWEERYGTEIASKRRWQIVATISLLVAATSLMGTVYLASTKEIQPYIVEVDKSGGILKVSAASKDNPGVAKKVLTAQMASFIRNVRNVIVDAHQQRTNVYQAYAFLRENTPAHTKITEHFRKNDPFQRARKETVFTEVINILEIKENNFEIEWRETVMDRSTGITIKTLNYKMVAFISLSAPNNVEHIIKNPLGLIINDLNWTKEI